MPKESQPQSRSAVVGQLGENLVSQWLQQQGWSIVARGWTSRWGELDIVARKQGDRDDCLAFVEVKTRSGGNWDEGGLVAITRSKQTKLWKTAQLFLAQHPSWAEMPCRFDVALVNARSKPQGDTVSIDPNPIVLGQPVVWEGYVLTLHTYLESAFEMMS
ncbi:MAG: YraN family protein [Thermosynechococcaceae cyanobacterium]